ncbi:pyridoxine 5-phosphate synthase [Hydrocarboniphaga daqingensis]|uniref:Pyridoxine 5'-phosphate synthase n=1 Tax=Hydrocarboniphaga daqingensis TaxID=490188 RepID=A0A1M5KIA5_9GAMM|nr:pyridoxine 5'-phosphate synthase [Hydrocarboniphaga daqingensis]SHG52604.1 pyridoxine 5-phosphate synthase [Hydrocarboniphaga daqingensis]
MSPPELRLGVNVDHVATVRQARGAPYPDPVEAALIAAHAGAHSITVHLREDRRHIQDHDVQRLLAVSKVPVNLEMAVTDEMVAIARRLKPAYVCLVPEKREERTTEGGLDIAGQLPRIRAVCDALADAGIVTSLFVDPDPQQLEACIASGAPHLEIHTGRYADAAHFETAAAEFVVIDQFAKLAHQAGIEVHAGHGLNLHNVAAVAGIAEIVELNIGHAIVARALMVGIGEAVREMAAEMRKGRG